MFPEGIKLNKLEDFNRIGIAFSGGLDSSVLLSFITENFSPIDKLYALHVNHDVHEDSDQWEEFCKEQASKLNINFKAWKLTNLSKNSEEVLRDNRYLALQSWAQKDDLIITAHHLDDQIETLLFRIFRGSGINGLQGMKKYSEINELNIFRPFLDTKKEELLFYAKNKQLNWIDDSSNNENHYSRNIIRNSIIPKISERWPDIDKSLIHLSKRAKKNQEIITDIAIEDYESVSRDINSIDKSLLANLTIGRQENLIYYWLNTLLALKVTSKQLNEIISVVLNPPEGSSSFNLHSKKGSLQFKLFISSDVLNLVDANSINELPQGFQENWNLKDIIKIPTGVLSSQKLIGKGLDKKYLSSEVIIRKREGGERCKPFGRNKSQKIKNLFQEFKIPDWKRDKIPLIYIDGRIAAVGDLWVCDEFHANSLEEGISIIWDGFGNKNGE